VKLLLVTVGALALVWSAGAAGSGPYVPAPTGLHAFVYRADEPVKADHTYALMPAFSWNGVKHAQFYDLQVATSDKFADATTVFSGTFNTPVASVQTQVPWMTGRPWALWVRVRAKVDRTKSAWSKPFGFNTAWQVVPTQLPAPDGLIRWTPIQGATGYDVLMLNVPSKPLGYRLHFTTLSNVADERDYWTFHTPLAKTVSWRVRAIRLVQNASLPNGLPVVTYGPYSPVFTTQTSGAVNPGPIQPVEAASDAVSTAANPQPHELTPGFSWTGTTDALGDTASGLWRVYVFSDKQCVNPVLVGSVVGSPAWAPRESDPLTLPADTAALGDAASGIWTGSGPQTGTYAADGTVPAVSESTPVGGSAPSSSDGSTTPSSPPSGSVTTPYTPRTIALPDNGWPQGRYWWTVVPVGIVAIPPPPSQTPPASGSGSNSGGKATPPPPDKLEYHDLAVPQDLCAAGQVWPFGMQSAPVMTTASTPFASGLVGERVVSAARRSPGFEELPVVTWRPALAAMTYQVQLSRRIYPWGAVHSLTSVVPSAVLPLTRADVGTWYYRVRGVNPNLTGPAQYLAWSKPAKIRITGDRFTVAK
jgi:hypothetical protein